MSPIMVQRIAANRIQKFLRGFGINRKYFIIKARNKLVRCLKEQEEHFGKHRHIIKTDLQIKLAYLMRKKIKNRVKAELAAEKREADEKERQIAEEKAIKLAARLAREAENKRLAEEKFRLDEERR